MLICGLGNDGCSAQVTLVHRSWQGMSDCNVRPYKPTIAMLGHTNQHCHCHTKSLRAYQPEDQRDIAAEVVIQTDLGMTQCANECEAFNLRTHLWPHSSPGADHIYAPQTPCLMPHTTPTLRPLLSRSIKAATLQLASNGSGASKCSPTHY